MPALDAYAQPLDAGQQVQQDVYQQGQADLAQKRKANDLAMQEKQTQAAQLAQEAQTKSQMPIAGVDMLQWGDTPEYHGKAWHELPQEARDHFTQSYVPSVAANAPKLWNESVAASTGRIPGVDDMEAAGATVDASGNVTRHFKPHDEIDKNARLLRTQAARMGITPSTDATPEEIQDLMATASQKGQSAKEEKDALAAEAKKGIEINQIKRLAQTNPQLRFYQAARANYDSIEKNVGKPVRTGADDAFLLQAASTMEAPGRSPTASDVKEFMRANGIRGNIETLGDRWGALVNQSPEAQAKAGRLLSDALAKQIADAARNALETRRSSLTEAMAPHVNRLEDIGEDPYRHLPKSIVDDVYGVKESPSKQDQFTVGQVYIDKNGNRATYQGSGQWK